MRSRSLLAALLLPGLLAACYDAAPVPVEDGVVLVHASDPHLLDSKRGVQQPLNRLAFSRMMDTLRVIVDSTRPHYLVLTGDLGIESTDPRYVPSAARDTTQPNPVLAKARLDSAAGILARHIREGPFRDVYFVPGNNDVYLEDADPASWSLVRTFVDSVQARIKNDRRQFRDLTACYQSDTLSVDLCIARIDTPYVLVGFPSLSFKNAYLDSAEYRKFLFGKPPWAQTPFDTAMPARVRRHDSLHLALFDRFHEVLSRARTRGGRRIIILTHIPDLDDPASVGRRLGRGSPPTDLRLPAPPGEDAWNASPAVFREWKRIVDSEEVVGVLAGHFHDSHRETYYRPYAWSRSADRADRWKVFVTPPLAIKFQDTSPMTARGFSLLTLRTDTLRRRLHWYELDPERFIPDSALERPRSDSSAAAPGARRAGPCIPGRSADHTAVFVITLLAAALAFALWPARPEPDVATSVTLPAPANESRSPAAALRRWRTALRALGVAALAGVIAIGALQAAFGIPWSIWPFAIFWMVALFAFVVLLRALILPMLRRRWAKTRFE